MIKEFDFLFKEIVNPKLTIRRINIAVTDLISVVEAQRDKQLDLFETDQAQEALEKERALQKVTIEIKEKFGKNAILRALDYTEGATTRARNKQIGGHNA